MKLTDAAHILGLSGNITESDVKQAYRRAAQKYHPDRNPAGGEMMKLINAAYEALKDNCGTLDTEELNEKGAEYPEAVNDALNAILDLAGLDIEICGAWVWVYGDTKPHRAVLKEAGFKWAPKKKRWYFRPEDWRSRSRGGVSMDEIRGKYGSSWPGFKRRQLEA